MHLMGGMAGQLEADVVYVREHCRGCTQALHRLTSSLGLTLNGLNV